MFDKLFEAQQKMRRLPSSGTWDWEPPESMLCLDPGETTGIALFCRTRLKWWNQLPTGDPVTAAKSIESVFITFHPALVVCEDYRVYGHRLKQHENSALLTPRIIGMIESACHRRGIPLTKQMASLGKGFVTDEKLHAWQMFKNGKHARDAIRHGLYYLLFHRPSKIEMRDQILTARAQAQAKAEAKAEAKAQGQGQTQGQTQEAPGASTSAQD
jgi:hypothetical protein